MLTILAFTSAICNSTWSFAQGAAGPSITNDKFEPTITISSALKTFKAPDADFAELMLRTWVDKKTKIATHQLYLSETYTAAGWRNFNAAYDDRATPHDVVSIAQTVNSCGHSFGAAQCSYSETYGVSVSDAQMRDYAKKGVDFKINGKDGSSFIISLSPGVVNQQLALANSYVDQPYQIDLATIPGAPIGAELHDEGAFNRKFYSHLDQGLHVGSVVAGSPLDKAGVKRYDWLWELNGTKLYRDDDLAKALNGVHEGSVITGKVRRGDQIMDVSLTF